MRKRCLRWLAGFAILMVVGLVFCFPMPRYLLWGWVRQESFFRGKPTSYWRDAVMMAWKRLPTPLLDRARSYLGVQGSSEHMSLLEGDPKSLPVLLALLDDSDQMVRMIACNGIGNVAARARDSGAMPPDFSDFTPRLVQLVEEGTPSDRRSATFTLGWLGPDARAAIPAIEKGLEETRYRLRIHSASALCRIDVDHEAGLTVLLDGLRDPDSIVRINAMEGLEWYLSMHGDLALNRLRPRQEHVLGGLGETRDRAAADSRPTAREDIQRASTLIKRLESALKLAAPEPPP